MPIAKKNESWVDFSARRGIGELGSLVAETDGNFIFDDVITIVDMKVSEEVHFENWVATKLILFANGQEFDFPVPRENWNVVQRKIGKNGEFYLVVT